jgi:predicted DNA-binding transcriptional regulator AlpA
MSELVVLLTDAQLDALAELVAAKLANGNGHQPPETPDTLLTVDEAAKRLGVRARWLYGHDLPFTVRLPNSRAVRFSEVGIAKWLARKRGL